MSLKYAPLTVEQQARLSPEGERVWTEAEEAMITTNLRFYDSAQRVSALRCSMADCKYVLSDERAAYQIPNVGLICDLCWQIHMAVRFANMKDGSKGPGERNHKKDIGEDYAGQAE
jgi:hypothetical protein